MSRTRSDSSERFHTLLVLLAAVMYGTLTVGGRYFAMRGWSLYEISLIILWNPIALLPVLVWRRFRLPQGAFRFFAGFGFLGALLQLSQFAGPLLDVPVAIVALLLHTAPVWTFVFGVLLLGERVTSRALMAATLAIAGVAVMLLPSMRVANYPIAGVFAALAGGLFLSLWLIYARRGGIRGLHPFVSTFCLSLSTGLWLIVLHPLFATVAPAKHFTRIDPSVYVTDWPGVVLYVIVAGIVPAWLFFIGMRSVKATTAAILLLLEPVSASLLARLLFGQPLTGYVLAGGVLILLGSYLVIAQRGTRRVDRFATGDCDM